jgi:hypothetical protein
MPKKFYGINPMGLYYKTLRIRNLREIVRFRSKLVTLGRTKTL